MEHRGTGQGDVFEPFTVLEEAMGVLRETYGTGGHDRDLVRESQELYLIAQASAPRMY